MLKRNILIILYLFVFVQVNAMTAADSLRIRLEQEDGFKKYSAYYELSMAYFNENDKLNSYICLDSIITYSEYRERIYKISFAFKVGRDLEAGENSYKDWILNSFHYLDSVYSKSDSKDVKALKALLLKEMGLYCIIYDANYKEGIEYLINGLRLAEELKLDGLIMECNRLLGFGNRYIRNYVAALENIRVAENVIYKSLYDSSHLPSIINEKANVYYFLDMDDSSLYYHNLALTIADRLGDQNSVNYISHDLAFMYYKKQDYEEALKYFLTVFKEDQDSRDLRDISISAANVANCYNNLGAYDDALKYINIAHESATKMNLPAELQNAYFISSQIYASLNDYQTAYQHAIISNNLKDSIYNSDLAEVTSEMQTRYETDKKVKENELLRQQMKIKELELQRNKNIRNFIIIVAVLIILYLFFLYRSFRTTSRLNKKLRELNETKDKLFSIIGHDIKNPLNAVMGFSDYLDQEHENIEKNEVREISKHINESANSIYRLLENLLEWAQTQTKTIKFKPEIFTVNSVIEETLQLLKPAAKNKLIEMRLETDEDQKVYADQKMLHTILRNLISNAIKFTEVKGMIQISVSEQDDKVQFCIADNGIGMDASLAEKIFEVGSGSKSLGTANESGTGIGLLICKEFIDMHGGDIWFETEVGSGSSFYFSLPLKFEHEL